MQHQGKTVLDACRGLLLCSAEAHNHQSARAAGTSPCSSIGTCMCDAGKVAGLSA